MYLYQCHFPNSIYLLGVSDILLSREGMKELFKSHAFTVGEITKMIPDAYNGTHYRVVVSTGEVGDLSVSSIRKVG